jgi:hypothetical protein
MQIINHSQALSVFRAIAISSLLITAVCAEAQQKGRAGTDKTGDQDPPAVKLIISPEPSAERGNSSRFASIRPLPDAPVTVVATLDFRPLGIAMTRDERLFVSIASGVGDRDNGQGLVREILPDGTSRPFPPTWFAADRDPNEDFSEVNALAADSRGVLWILDSGSPPARQPKLVGWNLKEDSLSRVIYLPAPITKANSSLQSIAIDVKRDMAYIADQGRADFVGTSEPAIITVDLKTGMARRALEDHYSLNADGGDFVLAGEPLLAPDGKGSVVRPSLGIVSVAIDAAGDYLLFGSANARSVFRIQLEALANNKLSSAQLGERVERVGDKPASQGISTFNANYLLVSDLNNNGIGAVFPDGTYQLLTSSEEISWPTGFTRGPRGEFYLVSSQFHRAPLFHRGEDKTKRPFSIFRIWPQITRVEAKKAPPSKGPKQNGRR